MTVLMTPLLTQILFISNTPGASAPLNESLIRKATLLPRIITTEKTTEFQRNGVIKWSVEMKP
jgi:hypothetical protein